MVRFQGKCLDSLIDDRPAHAFCFQQSEYDIQPGTHAHFENMYGLFSRGKVPEAFADINMLRFLDSAMGGMIGNTRSCLYRRRSIFCYDYLPVHLTKV